MDFNSSYEPQIKAQSLSSVMKTNKQVDRIVYFTINLKELFNIDINYPGIKNALNKALMSGKSVTPIDTGLMRSSFELKIISPTVIYAQYNPDKIVGRTRKGYKVTEYYPIYLAEKPKTFNWLSIVIKHFYDTLYDEVRKLVKKSKPNLNINDGINLIIASKFMEEMNKEYKIMKYTAKQERDKLRELKAAQDRKLREEKKRLNRIKNDIKKAEEE